MSFERKKTANHGNCITKERDTVKEATMRSVRAHDEWEQTHETVKIPCFKGYIIKEVKATKKK